MPTCTNLLGSNGRMSSGLPRTHPLTSVLARANRSPFESYAPSDCPLDATLATWSTRFRYAACGSGSVPMGCMKSPYAHISTPARASGFVAARFTSASHIRQPR